MNTTKATGMMLAAGMLAMPLTGWAAEGLSYGFVELDYIQQDVDQPGESTVFPEDFDNGDGWRVKASLPVAETFFIFADYMESESDFGFVDNQGIFIPGGADILRFDLGAGFIMPMSATSDVLFSGAYVDLDYEDFNFGGGEQDLNSPGDIEDAFDDLNEDASDGYFLDVAWRSQLTDNVEGSIGARYTDIESLDGLSLIGNVMYEFTPNIGVNLSVDAGDELFTWGLGARYSF